MTALPVLSSRADEDIRGETPGAADAAAGRLGSGLSVLSMRDEKIVLYARKGHSAEGVAWALRHDVADVRAALDRALGIEV